MAETPPTPSIYSNLLENGRGDCAIVTHSDCNCGVFNMKIVVLRTVNQLITTKKIHNDSL